jgi:uncharacterized membrane protein
MSVDQPRFTATPSADEGKPMAMAVYVLFLLSLPSIGLLMVVGVVLAYATRGTAAPWVRTHLDKEIKVFWTTVVWTVILGLAWVVSAILVLVLIGFALLWVVGLAGAVLAIWFHVISFIGLMRLAQDKPAEG